MYLTHTFMKIYFIVRNEQNWERNNPMETTLCLFVNMILPHEQPVFAVNQIKSILNAENYYFSPCFYVNLRHKWGKTFFYDLYAFLTMQTLAQECYCWLKCTTINTCKLDYWKQNMMKYSLLCAKATAYAKGRPHPSNPS